MTGEDFRLPSAWRHTGPNTGADTGPGRRIEVEYADLARALDGLGGPLAVAAAAHVRVLSTLAEDSTFRTDLLLGGEDRSLRALAVAPGAARTWRELVAHLRRALDAPADPAPESDPALLADRVLFAAEAAVLDEPYTARGHGLRVDVAGRTLVLHAGGFLADGELRRLAALYRRVLEKMAAAPDGDTLAAVLTDDERNTVLRRWALGRAVTREDADVLELFRRQAARTPAAPAVRSDGRTASYRELDERSTRIAHHLIARGARPEQPVGVCLRRGPDLLPVLLGVWKSGAPYLPLDAGLPAARLRHMVDRAGCALVVTRTEHLPLLGALDRAAPVLLDRERAAIDALSTTPVRVPAGPARLAYVIHTSGSTGTPKGVMVHHAGLANYVLWAALEYAARGTGGSPHFSSVGFDLGVPSLFAPLVVGQRVDLLPDPLDPADLGALLVEGAPYSFVKMTPGHLSMLSTDLDPEEAHGLAGLVVAAGDAFPVELARRWGDLAGPGGTPVATEYGPTEITVGNSGQVITRLPADGLIPLGLPIPNTTMYVLDDHLEPVPDGVPGEVYVGGSGVARGYLDAPALTAARFLPDPYGAAGSRLYRTGDRGRWRGGQLEFLGRTDHQVKIRGHRVEPGEVRGALKRRAEVGEAVVFAYPGRSGAQRLAAFVVPAPGTTLDPAEVRAGLTLDLPAHLVPSDLLVVDEIPLTANGKVDTRGLRARVPSSQESERR